MPRHKQSDPSTIKNHIKNQVIRLRVTEAEAQLFKVYAAEAGCKSISEYIRSRGFGEDTVDTATVTDMEKKAKSSKK